jgi:hypothetical protein
MLQVSVLHRSSCQAPRGYNPIPEMHRGSIVTGFFPRGEPFSLAPRAGVRGEAAGTPLRVDTEQRAGHPAHVACLVVVPAKADPSTEASEKVDSKWSLDTRLALLRGMRRDYATGQGSKAQTRQTMDCPLR